MKVDQYAALPIGWTNKGKPRVLLITSRQTRRWVMPKGWPMTGKKPWRAAEIEAMEEAGVLGSVSKVPLGLYEYRKLLDDGEKVTCQVTLYPLVVERLLKRWPERDERRRMWFSPKGAAKAVNEKSLKRLLLSLKDDPLHHLEADEMRKAS